ncbi:MAG: PilZ domain-containing protein [Candidatus Omnitrophica bacterium]|nr:PilZ domain-containing protein [Candidatus Omnitrophota bacterium]MBU1811114.1 PilZ domain-containing protein [Candidatus Omnitrophota bacterium]MBU2437264.1 PilZ domain-containing protein [Candidatus Omnitrophota bacterium]
MDRRTRRSYKRFKVDTGGRLIVDKEIEKPLIVRDLSSRGVGVVANYPFEIDKKITIDMETPFFHDTVRREARVIWCKKIEEDLWRAGLDFGMNKIEFPH